MHYGQVSMPAGGRSERTDDFNPGGRGLRDLEIAILDQCTRLDLTRDQLRGSAANGQQELKATKTPNLTIHIQEN